MSLIHFFSDLHLEFLNEYKFFGVTKALKVNSDILFLGGDIGNIFANENLAKFLKYLSPKFNQIYYVCGNHEFYDVKKKYSKYFGDLNDWFNFVHSEMEKISFPNINLFTRNNTSTEFLNDKELIACTLWSNIDLNQKERFLKEFNDFNYIPNMTCENYLKEFLHDSSMLNEKMLKDKAKIVLTHHYPINDDATSNFASLYGSDLNHLLEKSQCWFAGHQHRPTSKIENFYTNPIGYRGESFDQDKKLNKVFLID
jgi:predicted MPP superfamily phosphohydrolase